MSQLTSVADRVEQAVEKGENITTELEERLTAGERMVKGIKEVSTAMKEERPSLAKVEKASSLGMIVGGVTLLLSGAVLGLIVMDDKELVPEQLDIVTESVDGISESVNVIAGQVLDQQQQMDEAMESMNSLQTAFSSMSKPAEEEVEEMEGEAPKEVAEVTIDFSAVEGKIDETQQKILALHEQLKSAQGRYPELKKHLQQLVVGQKQLKSEQSKLLQIQQAMSEQKERGKTIYKFP